jgi:hypothetical protein
VKVIYGEMPAQFVKEWERHIGDLIVVDNLHVRGKETKEIAASFNRKK